MTSLLIGTLLGLGLSITPPARADLAGAAKDFQAACEASLKKNPQRTEICDCVVANYRIRKLDESQIRLLQAVYEHRAPKKQMDDEDMLLDFDEDLAGKCVKDPKTRILPGPSEDAEPTAPKTAPKK